MRRGRKVSGDEMKLTGEVVGMDRTFEMTAKRA
jgi:carbamoylphosphate synthase large subunit